MKKTTKKGFTLVELLVVIAILAILATVSVVGYTAFIERATVSNDENVAAQLNQFLTAMKADSTGKYYGKDITPDNVWEVIDAALAENGTLTDLEPQALEYGYHYFYKFDGNETDGYKNGEIVVAKDSAIITTSAIKAWISGSAAGEENNPGFFSKTDAEGKKTLYFLLDTKGSSIAIAVRGFYTLDGITWDEFTTALENSKSEQDNKTFASDKVFITSGGNKTIDGNGGKTESITHKDVQKITTEGDDDLSSVTGEIEIPDSVKVIGNDALASLGSGTKLVTDKTPEELAEMLSGHNENEDKEITVKTGDTEVKIKVEGNENKVVNGGNEINCTFSNPVQSVTIEVVQVDNKVKTVEGDATYVAWDHALKNDVQFKIKPVGKDSALPASYASVSWKLGEADASDSIRFEKNAVQTVSVDVDGKTASVTVKFVYITGVSKWNFEGKTLIFGTDNKASVEITKEITADTTFELKTDVQTFTYSQGGQNGVDGITLDKKITISEVLGTGETAAFTVNSLGLKFVDGRQDLTNARDIKITVDGYFERTLSVKIFNANNLTFKVKYNDLKYVGDDNPITLDSLFELNSGMEMPDNAIVMFRKPYKNTSTTPENFTYSDLNSYNSELITIEGSTDESPKLADISISTLAETSLQFKNGKTSDNDVKSNVVTVFIAVPTEISGEYRKISKTIELHVVDAWNINGTNPQIDGEYVFKTDSFTGCSSVHTHIKNDCNDSTKGAHETIEHNLVLLSDYVFTDRQYLGLKNSTLWGNLFTLDVTNGRNNSTGIVELVKSTLKDTKVVADEYTQTNDAWYTAGLIGVCHVYDKEYSAAAVRTYGDASTISNCYISGARAPLRVESSGTTLNDVVLFGGAYANLDIQNPITVNLNNVVTVNQYQYNVNDNVNGNTVNAELFGGGIIVANAEEKPAQLNIGGEKGLRQFNFIGDNSDQLNHVIDEGTVSIKDVAKGSVTIFGKKIDFSDKLAQFKYSKNDTGYFSAGIISLKTTENTANGYSSLNIYVNKSLAFPNGYSKSSVSASGFGVSVAAFNNTKTTPDDFDSAAFETQYGFAFSIEKFIAEASKYHPSNIGKTSTTWTGSYVWDYRD